MGGNSIRPRCWSHPAKIHQSSWGHLRSCSEGTFLSAQTKGRRNMLALWTHFWNFHLCRRTAVIGEWRKMTKLTKNSESRCRSVWNNACHLFIVCLGFGHAMVLANKIGLHCAVMCQFPSNSEAFFASSSVQPSVKNERSSHIKGGNTERKRK